MRGSGSVEPLIILQNLKRWTQLRICTKEGIYKSFEGKGKKSFRFHFLVKLPKLSKTFLSYEAIVTVMCFCALKRRSSTEHSKQDYSYSEKIGFKTSILSVFHFGGTVPLSANPFCEILMLLYIAGKSKVCKFEVEVLV